MALKHNEFLKMDSRKNQQEVVEAKTPRLLGGRLRQDAAARLAMLSQVSIMETYGKTENINRYEELLGPEDGIDLSFLEEDNDMLLDKLFDSIHSSPLGKLLSVMSTLPEVRTEKVEHARRQINQPEECWDIKMDMALDRVLEELIIEE
jgi:hypothetical protein